MNQPPAAQQPLRAGSQDPKYGPLAGSASSGNLHKKQYGLTGPFTRTFGAQGTGGQGLTDLDDGSAKTGQQGARDLASARSLFGRGKRPLRSMRLDPRSMYPGANLQSINMGSHTTKANNYNNSGQENFAQPSGHPQQAMPKQQRFDQFINLMGYQNNNRTNFYQQAKSYR